MKLPSARVLGMILAEGLLLIVLATLASFVLYQRAQNQLSQAYEARYQSYLLAEELRTSSDDLTSLARLYVVTGDLKFRQEYNDVLGIRAGRIPRPTEYYRIYWDYISAGREKPRPDGDAVAFEELIGHSGFIGAEFAKLKQAEDRSNGLARREAIAMNAVNGDVQNASGGAAKPGELDRKSAIDMMFSNEYLQAKVDIMEPIDQFFGLMDKRTNLAVFEAAVSVDRYRTLTFLFLGMLSTLSLCSGWWVLRLRHLNEVKWTKQLLQSGWSALPNIIIEKQAELGLDPIDMNIVIHLLHWWTSADELPSPTVEMIANEIGVSARTVQKHIGDLQASGLITRVERRNTRSGSAANLYSLDGLIRATMPFTVGAPPVKSPDLNSTASKLAGDPDAGPIFGLWRRVMSRFGFFGLSGMTRSR